MIILQAQIYQISVINTYSGISFFLELNLDLLNH